jgi:formate dehydrogenase major subunit
LFRTLAAGDFARRKGLTVVEIMDAIHAGEIKGMYILGENPAMSDPDVEHARDALAMLEHLVVQDIFLTETANYADVILPAAPSEKTGTVTNTNRQVQMGRQAVPRRARRARTGGSPRLARRLGLDWNYTHPREVFAEMKQRCASLDNITWERLEKGRSPIPACRPTIPVRRSCSATASRAPAAGRASRPAVIARRTKCPMRNIPMMLITGRQLEHWHTGSMTRRLAVLDALEPEANCSLHPATLRRLGLSRRAMVRLTTPAGRDHH